MSVPSPVAILDAHPSANISQFLKISFGTYGNSLTFWPIARNMTDVLRPVTFVPQHIQSNKRRGPRVDGDVVATEHELLKQLATRGDLLGVAQISPLFSTRFELRGLEWSRTFNFIVGDSFADRIIFWNGQHQTPAWLDGYVATLKVSEDDLNDAERFNEIVCIIKNRVHFPLGGSASHTKIMVRSFGVSKSNLDNIADRLRAANSSNVYTTEHLPSVDAVVPSRSVLRASRFLDPGFPFQSREWEELTFTQSPFRPAVTIPRHIRDTPYLPPSAKQGLWEVDLQIERSVDYSWVQNVQHYWKLPRRLRMVGAFVHGYQLNSTSPFCMPRATADGLLSLLCGGDGQLLEINVPTDDDAFRYAICAPRDWWPFVHTETDQKPGLSVKIRPSDRGRYLTAILRMSDGIHRAKEIFLSQFWKEHFERLGTTTKPTERRIDALKLHLRKKCKAGCIDSDDEWTRLAMVVLAEARNERFPSRHLKFEDLRSDFTHFRDVYRTKHALTRQQDNDNEPDAIEVRSLAASVRYFCQRGILLQGHEWRCHQCFNTNWESIENLEQIMNCEVCGRTEPAPVAETWHFKLNGFVLEGLREHGLLPVIWCLANLSALANTSFFYFNPYELFFTQEAATSGISNAELDLLIVSDGVVRLVEAKASSRGLDIAKTAELAKRRRPDVVTLAVMETESPNLKLKLSELKKQLSGTDVDADLMTLNPDDIDCSPWLPTGNTYWTRVF